MADNNQQITPADAAIVSSGTGTKGPEERDLPHPSKKKWICVCRFFARSSANSTKLLATFDEVREYALNASAERFAGILTDTNSEQDDLQNAVNTIDKMNVED